MKADVLALAADRPTAKGASKETLNHPELIRYATGRDPFTDTAAAYHAAYARLGIDLVNRVPLVNAPPPTAPGTTVDVGDGYVAATLGVYDTVTRTRFPFASVEEFLSATPAQVSIDYAALRTPVPHPLLPSDIQQRQTAIGDVGLYYCQLYTTLFMWGVEYLGWEVFLLAAALDPDALDRLLLQPAFAVSRRLVAELAQADGPFVFCHDDLADKRGPMLHPDWYDRYVFPRYRELFAPAKARGKKIIFVADGNMEPFLERLLAVGVDGVMFENPATPLAALIEAFGDKIIIGGIETDVLQHATPTAVRDHVHAVVDTLRTPHGPRARHGRSRLQPHTGGTSAAGGSGSHTGVGGSAAAGTGGYSGQVPAAIPGFAMSTPGGLHGAIPLENLIAYFDARVETGYTPAGWARP